MRQAVFLDRDGTLCEEIEYLHRVEDLRLFPGVFRALARLKQAGYLLVVVTNQAGVGRGFFEEADVEKLHEHMSRIFEHEGATIDAFYYCPYHPQAAVDRYRKSSPDRKPGAGMLLRAAEELGIDLARSVMIGDHEKDVEAGRRAGCRTVLVGTGYGSGFRASAEYDHFAVDLKEAADWILS